VLARDSGAATNDNEESALLAPGERHAQLDEQSLERAAGLLG